MAIFSSTGVATDRAVESASSSVARDAVGSREGDELVGRGEARVVAGFAQRIIDRVVVERSSPRRADPRSVRSIE